MKVNNFTFDIVTSVKFSSVHSRQTFCLGNTIFWRNLDESFQQKMMKGAAHKKVGRECGMMMMALVIALPLANDDLVFPPIQGATVMPA